MKNNELIIDENRVLEIINMFDSDKLANGISLYFHIPFCTRRCSYCNYVSSEKKGNLIEPYFNSLMLELDRFKDQIKGKTIRAIYIGGGTPSLVRAELIEQLLQKVKSINNFDLSKTEITIELNPETVTKSKLEIYKRSGINRLSVGLQSANNKLLALVNRFSSKEMFDAAMSLIKQVGFTNVSVDIMIGLPKQKLVDVKKTLKLALSYDPANISVYSLILEKETPLYELVKQKKVFLPSEEKTIKAYDYVFKTLQKNNYNFYEIGNFAKTGFESINNINYWFHGNFLGFGAGAYGLVDSYDYITDENIEDFANQKTKCERELKSIDEIQTEKIMLGLRTIYGIALSLIKPSALPFIKVMIEGGYLEYFMDRLRATKKGFYVLNSIILQLI